MITIHELRDLLARLPQIRERDDVSVASGVMTHWEQDRHDQCLILDALGVMLKEIEWSSRVIPQHPDIASYKSCPVCSGIAPYDYDADVVWAGQGHKPDCLLSAFLRGMAK